MTEDEKIYYEIFRQTEHRLESQQAIASERDQRSLVITGFSVVSAGLVSRWAEEQMALEFAISAMLFLFAAFFSAVSTFPWNSFIRGYTFDSFNPYILQAFDRKSLLKKLGRMNDDRIFRNEESERRSKKWHCFGVAIFLLGALFTVGNFAKTVTFGG